MISNHLWIFLALSAILLCVTAPGGCSPGRVKVGDAYARASSDGKVWTIGAAAVEMTYDCGDGRLVLSSFRNRLASPAREYVSKAAAVAPFSAGSRSSAGRYAIETLWTKSLAVGASVDPGADAVRIAVKKGDLLGFGATTSSDDARATVAWTSTLDYGDGESYSSSSDTRLDQGPVWFTYIRGNGTGCMDPLGETVADPEIARVPSGYRAPAECSRITTTGFDLTNAFELVRVWKAPKDGTVTVRGAARHAAGGSVVRVSVLRIRERSAGSGVLPSELDRWTLESAGARQVNVGGRPAVQLDIVVRRDPLRARLHVQAYPNTSILRQWVEIENISSSVVSLGSPAPVTLGMQRAAGAPLTSYWMCGGTCRPNQGALESAPVTAVYNHALLGDRSDNYVPWMALQHQGARDDGLFVALDHLGVWSLALDAAPGQTLLSAGLPEFAGRDLAPGKSLRLPTATIGVFRRNLDDMGRRVYDWQYEYLWDFTNSDYFARTKWAVSWFFCSRNLQEQFAARLAGLDMDADLMRTMGIEMLWDDAGWSKYPGWPIPDNYGVVFSPSFEGPDYAETLRYLGKMDMNWLLWFAGRPSAGLLDTKVGSWGDFQWRTDGFGRFGIESDHAIRNQIEHFLTANPGSSFHTCDGGSRYAHQFEIQRLADVNYLSDMGRDAKTNHYLSYIDPPDKWMDIIDPLTEGGRYNPDIALGQLTMAPAWYAQAVPEDREQIRRLMELYRYLRQEGVVGRWSYMMHPTVRGDSDYYYDQRTSRDRKRACLILKHRAPGKVLLYPQDLLPDYLYAVCAGHASEPLTRSGADLMANGLPLAPGSSGGVITLGLPKAPGSGRDREAPIAPGLAYARRETNLGHSGVALYWSPGADDNWVSYYEVRRGAAVIGKASVGTYYFDHAAGWDADASYAVRTVDGDGNVSGWVTAAPLAGGQDGYAALGGHFHEAGRDGWSAESAAAAPMRFVPAARNPAGDLGGTPNQPGGVEGYWEGPGKSRIGRGWQQASPEEECVRVWTAPKAGRVRIVGRAMKECYRQAEGGALRVRILHGAHLLWPERDWAEVRPGDWTGAMHDLTVDVAAGDSIRFVLDRGSSPDTDIIAWMPRIVYQDPETAGSGSVVRILCGSKAPYTDRSGNVWSADAHYSGGRIAASKGSVTSALLTIADAQVYRRCREGKEFAYVIRVRPGLYAVRLRFAETKREWASERPMNVSINGRRVLENFDICQAARGPMLAVDRTFRNLVPNADGNLVLKFSGGFDPCRSTDMATVNAIEVLPEAKTLVRIDAGSEAQFIDWNSFPWSADRFFEGGHTIRSGSWTAQASPTLYDQSLYQAARSGRTIRYAVPAAPGLYTVHLKFAELWLKEAGKRPMNIDINGSCVRERWDPATAAGQVGMAADFRIANVTPDGSGKITITLSAVGANDAILQGIEIE